MGRSRTSCTLKADAITNTSDNASRWRASRIMRPTRGSSGSLASSSHPIGTDTVAPGRARVEKGAIAVASRLLRRKSMKTFPGRSFLAITAVK